MPTGYTADIVRGVTFEQFVWSCARAFGANVMMRDDSPDAKIVEYEPNTKYHDDELANARRELHRVQAMTIEECDAEAEKEYQVALATYRKNQDARAADKAKYESMLIRVRAWHPPTKDHEGLKEFMVSQIEETIKFDCAGYEQFMPKATTGREWVNDKLTRIAWGIRYHAEHREKEIDSCNSRNEWNRKLRESVPQPDSLKPVGATT